MKTNLKHTLKHASTNDEPEGVSTRERLPFPYSSLLVVHHSPPFVRIEVGNDIQNCAGYQERQTYQ